jgi:23S rRNA (adenine2030-N6)-methyltransferase
MNYRHAYHAGNFGDVFKHAALARILLHLRLKEAAFRVIETHAGAGWYELDADEARRTGEWREGIGEVLAAELTAPVATLISPWLDLARTAFEAQPKRYPGSPALALHFLRPQDRLVLCEKHPPTATILEATVRHDARVRTIAGDGWQALRSLIPPPERRGLVLIDPPFESQHEFATIIAALQDALRRWATGIYLVWYPIKARREVEWFARRLSELPAAKILRVEIGRFRKERVDRLNGCGVAILNPSWHLDEEMGAIAAALAPILARDEDGHARLEWLKNP